MEDIIAEVPELATERLQLRAIRRSDIDAVYAIYSDPRGMRYWSFPPWTDRRQAVEWFEWRRTGGLMDHLPWAATLEGHVVGLFTLFLINREQRRCELGYIVHPDHWKKGLAREGLRCILRHAFDVLRLERIEADIDPRNLDSCRLVEHLGFRREGLLRQRWRVGDEVSDSALYGLLRAEFPG
ncbi:GNAT family N-acetyltransferase [Tahibacter amnicola]|uniref:GNAT family N-acetyltransferase n=1 Tax=Tahibacter amnicola TaxID=2976241 RepID=A0ABY6BD07_9GAMM|nr:GNAT family N-acetyltransferase [Tahibacter amnicola]UXI67928.1 GNAT family N-acetyltransferase [Tahibacter amnicola]